MTAASENYPDQKGRTITITRTFDAPRSLVFDAFNLATYLATAKK